MLLHLLAFLLTWRDAETTHYTLHKTSKSSDWEKVVEDCPDPSCAVVFDETEYLSYLKVRFVPDTESDLDTRRYMWFYTLEGEEVGRIILSEQEGHWIQINKGPGTCNKNIKFTSTNTSNSKVDFRDLVIRATANGVHLTFPDNGTWAACAEWRVQRVAFDNFWRVDAKYSTVSNETNTDLCAGEYNNGTECNETPYCTAEGFCSSLQPDNLCDTIDNSSYCKSCSIEHTVSCNSTAHCIAPNWVCNGYKDCDNGEDELDCPLLPNQKACQGQNMEDGACQGSPSSAKKRLVHEIFIAFFCVICLRTI